LSTGVRREIVIVPGQAEQENLSAAPKLLPADMKYVDCFPRIVLPPVEDQVTGGSRGE
jgi:hypothetical protein